MKAILSFVLFFSLAAVTACSTTNNSSVSDTEDTRPPGSVHDDRDIYRSLADYLQQVPGVNVTGPAGHQMITIRGISTFSSGTEPLFVVNGQIVGSSYSQVNSMLNVKDIDYVRVLKGPDAATYGVRGGNGVVLIVTK